jgi:hypothetical protein
MKINQILCDICNKCIQTMIDPETQQLLMIGASGIVVQRNEQGSIPILVANPDADKHICLNCLAALQGRKNWVVTPQG